ncbi:MAG: 4Fe-4S dicluster domain-containing protein [bacterium]
MKPNNPPAPGPVLRYRNPPRPGNEINGLGEELRRRPSKVFHRPPMGSPEREPREWGRLDLYFNLIRGFNGPLEGLRAMRHVLINRWQLRRANGPVATERVADSPAEMAERVRAFIMGRYPEALVGFTEISEDAVYENEQLPYKYAVCIGFPMERRVMALVPSVRSSTEVMRVYRKVSRIAVETSEYIRALGWPAKAFGETKSTEILHIPLAGSAGLGQLGKHGSLISKEYGSNFRLATVATDLPVSLGEPPDLGVDDLCTKCRRCTIDCPPAAIFDAKQKVRGVEKWYVDFDKCIPYFVENGGCAICLEVCPWSEPGRGPPLSQKLLAGRAAGKPKPPPPAAR